MSSGNQPPADGSRRPFGVRWMRTALAVPRREQQTRHRALICPAKSWSSPNTSDHCSPATRTRPRSTTTTRGRTSSQHRRKSEMKPAISSTRRIAPLGRIQQHPFCDMVTSQRSRRYRVSFTASRTSRSMGDSPSTGPSGDNGRLNLPRGAHPNVSGRRALVQRKSSHATRAPDIPSRTAKWLRGRLHPENY